MTSLKNAYLRVTATQFARYMVVGVFGTIAHYTVLILFVEIIDTDAVVGSSAGAATGAFINYFLNYYFTFQSNRRHVNTIVQFYIVAATGFLWNALFMLLLADMMGIYYLAAQLITTGIVLLWGFWINRIWTFRTTTDDSGNVGGYRDNSN